MTTRPKILLTNDDGITSPGLFSLWRALAQHADITIVAPDSDQSCKGVSITTQRPLHITPSDWQKAQAYTVNGTTADCVKLAMQVLLPKPPDIIVSGINRGSNAGRNALYSGTIGGVIEGAMRNIPGIAFSCDDYDAPKFERAESYILSLVQYILAHPLTPGTFLNVTFPDHEGPIKGVRMARQGHSYWDGTPQERFHPSGDRYYFVSEGITTPHSEHPDSDIELVKQGYLTAVPLHIHQLTDHLLLENRKAHFEKWFA